MYEAGVKSYLTHRHFSSEQRTHQHEPEQSHRGRAKREKTRGRGGRKGEKEKSAKKPRDRPGPLKSTAWVITSHSDFFLSETEKNAETINSWTKEI